MEKVQTPSGQLPDEKRQTPSAESAQRLAPAPSLVPPGFALAGAFLLSWSHYVRLLSVEKPHAWAIYESEAIRGGGPVRQLDRQIGTQFFERAGHSKRSEAMLARAPKAYPETAFPLKTRCAILTCLSS